jgi:hypothetical protein
LINVGFAISNQREFLEMTRLLLTIAIVLQLSLAVFSQQTKLPTIVADKSQAPQTQATAHKHDAHGPNNGDLLEIGRGEYHAELVIDEESNQVIVYLLDSALKSYISIDASHLVVNFKVGNKPVQVKLLPVPQDADAQNLSSRFSLISPELFAALHDSKSDAKLSLRIGKKSYVSKLAHNHDRTGHNHPTSNPVKR